MLGLPGCLGEEPAFVHWAREMSLTGKAGAKFTHFPFRLLGRKRNT